MCESWTPVRLGDLATIKHGFAFKGEFFRDQPPGDILLTPGNFAIGGGYKDTKLKYYDGPVTAEYVLEEGALVVTMTDLSKASDTLGYPLLVPRRNGTRFLHNQRLGLVVPKDGVAVEQSFLFYVFKSRPYRHEIVAGATGTTVKHTSPKRILAYEFHLPPLSEQKAIAYVLGTLDDKIELNRKMNETLEAMARALFKSWFVDFDPVRAKMEGRRPFGMDAETAALFPDGFEDSELGPIPRGWNTDRFDTCVEFRHSSVNPMQTPDALFAHYSIPAFDQGQRPVIQRGADIRSNKYRIERNVILLSKLNPRFPRIWLADVRPGTDSVCSTEFIPLMGSRVPKDVLFWMLQSEPFYSKLLDRVTGTTGSRQRVRPSEIRSIRIVIPPKNVLSAGAVLLRKLDDLLLANRGEKATLAELRDTLLPKLLSGELRIKDAEKFVEQAV